MYPICTNNFFFRTLDDNLFFHRALILFFLTVFLFLNNFFIMKESPHNGSKRLEQENSSTLFSRTPAPPHDAGWLSGLKFGIILTMFLFSVSLAAQSSCSDAAITAKYWQYRQNLNKHFVATDRDPSGCVNDGIGQDATDSCKFSKAGYGLPATSIVQTPNGRFGLGSRSNGKANPPIFVAGLSSECMGETSLDDDGSDPNHKYNFLNVGSETLTQVGWHIVTLCTEYELLSKNGQTE